MSVQRWIRETLDERGIPYSVSHHDRVFTAQEAAQREHVSGHRLAKVVAVFADDKPVALVLPASRHVDLEQVRRALDAGRVRLASEEELARTFDDCQVGAVPPLRHWKNVEVYMDESLEVEGPIAFQAGTHEDVIKLNFRDWFDLVRPKTARFAELARF